MYAVIDTQYTIAGSYETFAAALLDAEAEAYSRSTSMGVVRIDDDGEPIAGEHPVWVDDTHS